MDHYKQIPHQSPKQTSGYQAEDTARAYLIKNGLQFVRKQFRTSLGEIDLIMKDKNEIVFVEVRSRENNAFGEPFESITRHKQKKLIRTAQLFLRANSWCESFGCRFDVISILGNELNFKITWIPNAFGVE